MQKSKPAGKPNRTRAQINRENAQKSTGPRTPEGKAASSRNAFKHGLHSKTFMLDVEDPTELDELRAELRDEHQPANATEEILVNDMAESFFRIRRARKSEAKMWKSLGMESWERWQPLILRIMSSAERAFHKALTALRQLQKDRGFVPQKAVKPPKTEQPEQQVDFVPQKTLKAPARQPLNIEFPLQNDSSKNHRNGIEHSPCIRPKLKSSLDILPFDILKAWR